MTIVPPPTTKGRHSSIDTFVNHHRRTTSVQQLYFDAAVRSGCDGGSDDAEPAMGASPTASGAGVSGGPSRSSSLANLAALHKLLEGGEGEHESARKTDAELAQLPPTAQNTLLTGFYCRQNAILDSWQEVDVILFSAFPGQVFGRFASRDQIRQISERKARKKINFVLGTSSPTVTEADTDGEVPRSAALPFQRRARPSPSSEKRGRYHGSSRREHHRLLSDDADGYSSRYGSVSDHENGLALSGHLRFSGKTLADIFEPGNNHLLGGSLSHATGSQDTILEMPGEDNVAQGCDVGRSHLAHEIRIPYESGDDGHEAGSSASEENVYDAEHAALGTEQYRSIAAHLDHPDGKREHERKRLMAHVPGLAEKDEASEAQIQWAININLAANVALLVGKIVACLASHSISLVASLVDSALDLLSTLIIFGMTRLIAHRSFHTIYKYPVGKRRFEPLGVVIFSVVLIASFLQVLLESCQRLWSCLKDGQGEVPSLPLVGIAVMLVTIVLKAVMWILYRNSPSSGVCAVAQDAENDVVFNVASLIFPRLGQLLGTPALDPVGGILLSLYIIREWIGTLIDQVTKLSGKACGSQEIARALYLVTRFKDVQSVSGFEVFHSGDGMIIEADVVLPYNISLKDAHDVGEVLTFALECLTGVERAYVHLDYNAHGPMNHLAQRG